MADQEHDSGVSPTREDVGVSTAPTLSAADEIAGLRLEVERLRSQLAAQGEQASDEVTDNASWPTEINYHQYPYSDVTLGGITKKQRDKIRPTTDFPELPRPTLEQAQLEADFMRWGYCLIKDAMSPQQIKAQSDRLLDQAAAECAAGVAHLSHRGQAQTVFNLLPKGQVFRDLSALEPSAAQQAPLVEVLLEKILDSTYCLATTHGSVVRQHGGRQDLHMDQGFAPLPHPPYPLYCLIIWTYTDFSLENGATYIVPGSHRDASGNNRILPGVDPAPVVDGHLMALTVPAGSCMLMDGRTLHSGGARTAPGTRLASRVLYSRGFVRQQENQLAAVPDDILDGMSPKLKQLIGFRTHRGLGMVNGNVVDPVKAKIPICELSMSRPEQFDQDFDWRYTKDAMYKSQRDWDAHVDYRGPK